MEIKSILLNGSIWQAVKFTGVNQAKIIEWSNGEVVYTLYDSDPFKLGHFLEVPVIQFNDKWKLRIIEPLRAHEGDWVLKKPNEHIFQVLNINHIESLIKREV